MDEFAKLRISKQNIHTTVLTIALSPKCVEGAGWDLDIVRHRPRPHRDRRSRWICPLNTRCDVRIQDNLFPLWPQSWLSTVGRPVCKKFLILPDYSETFQARIFKIIYENKSWLFNQNHWWPWGRGRNWQSYGRQALVWLNSSWKGVRCSSDQVHTFWQQGIVYY